MGQTPISNLRRQLGELRKQEIASASKADRLNTPARRNGLLANATYTTLKARNGSSTLESNTPGKLLIRAEIALSPVSSLRDHDMDTYSDAGEVEDEQDGEATPRSRSSSPSIPPSLSYTGLKEMLRPLGPPKTPSFVGMKEMFAPARSQPTPNYTGLRKMMQPQAEVATPSFVGVKEMFQSEVVLPSPGSDGMGKMQVDSEPAEEGGADNGLEAFAGEVSVEVETVKLSRATRSRAAPGGASRVTRVKAHSSDLQDSVSDASTDCRSRKAIQAAPPMIDVETPEEVEPVREQAAELPETRSTRSGTKPVETIENNVVSEIATRPPPSPAKSSKSTRSTRSRSSAKSSGSSTSRSSKGKSSKAKTTTTAESGYIMEIIRSSPARPDLFTPLATQQTIPGSISPPPQTKTQSRVPRPKQAGPLMDVADQFSESASAPAPSRGGKARVGAKKSVSAPTRTKKTVTLAVQEEDKENDAEVVKEKTKLRKPRQSTVASRTRSRT